MDLRSELEQHLGTAYRLQRELGGGGMSRVFLADEVRLGRQVVIKVLSPELTQGLNIERFEREIRLAASLQQANIVPLLAAGDVGGIPWFTMPYVEGESLRARLAQGPLPIADVVAVLRDVTRALAYAHARGVIHRDIKPDNVLLSGNTAVVTDFGIAKAINASRREEEHDGTGALTQLGTALGTPAYMAPEQVAGDPGLDARADLYSLGCMAYELLTGSPPFAGRTTQKIMLAHMSEAVPAIAPVRPDCPPALSDLVGRLLEKDPADRPQSATDVLTLLETAATPAGATLALPPAGAWWRALLVYFVLAVVLAIVAKVAVNAIGLPDWVFPGAVIIIGLGLPLLFLTAYVQRLARRAAAVTPTLTPGGSAARPTSGTVSSLALKASPHLTWQRALRIGVYAFGGFAIAVAAFMGLRAAGIGPWGSLFAAGKLAPDDRIVVADLAVAPGDSALAPILGEAVRAALGQSRSVRLVEPAEIAAVLQQMKRTHDLPLNLATAREVAQRAGAQAVLGGRLARVGTGYAVSLNLTGAQDGATLVSEQGTADGPGDLLQVVDELSRKLRGRMGESLKQVQQSVPLARATTASLPALRKYSEAVQANDVDQDYDRAVLAAREAVQLDSTFALAWRKLAIALSNANGPSAAIDSALEQTARYADRLPDREKYLALGAYYQRSRTAADRGKAFAAYRAAYAADSTNYVAANNLASIYSSQEKYDSALRYIRRERQLQPGARYAASLALNTLLASGVDSATRLFQAMPELASDPSAPLIRAIFYLTRQQQDSADRMLERMRTSPALPLRTSGLQLSAMDASIHGRMNDGASYFRELMRLQAASGAAPQIPELFDAITSILIRGAPAEGVKLLSDVLEDSAWAAAKPSDRPYLTIASLYARVGHPAQARTLLAQGLAADPTLKAPDAQARIAGIRGDIALAEGRPAEALQLYRTAAVGTDGAPRCEPCTDYDLARTFDQGGQSDSAIAYFERYLAQPKLILWSIDAGLMQPPVERRLGELYEEQHDRAKAMQHYSAFVDLWRDADADLQPMVATVKKRLGELASR